MVWKKQSEQLRLYECSNSLIKLYMLPVKRMEVEVLWEMSFLNYNHNKNTEELWGPHYHISILTRTQPNAWVYYKIGVSQHLKFPGEIQQIVVNKFSCYLDSIECSCFPDKCLYEK